MSKAFVKDDAQTDLEVSFEPLPLEEHYYSTPFGYKRLQAEIAGLHEEIAASPADLTSAKKRLHYLEELLRRTEVIDPVTLAGNQIRFGATVTIENENGEQHVYRIVGIYEADSKAGKVSYISPLAKALLGHREGDVVVLKTPQGEEELEVLKIQFVSID